MATRKMIAVPGTEGGTTVSALATVSSSAEIVIGNNAIFMISATGPINIRFGKSGMAAASASDFYLPMNSPATFDLSDIHDRIRVFNPGTGSIDVHILPLSRV